ncbi:MAG: L-serine ammonia-lyase, iron-sulfur-dependent, subunit alpha [Lachnospiraceae bacterium]|nr:L-serine ammonia-lyase, iron-sulfur-dependent, subunit alpha [Robinsoniella sp.]MDY3766555.1 L-serine ammonia-lyase, iron-sulfur-dependent, subunit alpha [Lachnospiraceae bacterium]
MSLSEKVYRTYCEILREELIPATGCTEPIAIAYAAAIARDRLGCMPKKMKVGLSRNIIKNVKSVVVPATGGMHGIESAAAAGVIAAQPEKRLEILSVLGESDVARILDFLAQCEITVEEIDTGHIFEIDLTAYVGEDMARVRILDRHTNVVLIEKNGETLQEMGEQQEKEAGADRSLLNVRDIVTFAQEVKIKDIEELLERQVQYNMAIAQEGLSGDYGACVGKVIYAGGSNDVRQRAKAMAAAGSDARMNGCELPVCILSGSGNQGITASVPVIVYAQERKASREEMFRALVVSDLVTIHQKTGIGCLSAYCGAISAGCGCGAGITFLCGGGYEEVAHTIVNAVAILSGTICDGAKSSCAAKISMAVEAGILGHEMYQSGHQFYGGEGIVTKGVENTIQNVGKLARVGMKDTDKEIVKIMLQKN